MTATDNPWRIRCTFRDGSTYRERALLTNAGEIVGIEERVFNADGSLRPLPDGRTSPADSEVPGAVDDADEPESSHDRAEVRRALRAERGWPDA